MLGKDRNLIMNDPIGPDKIIERMTTWGFCAAIRTSNPPAVANLTALWLLVAGYPSTTPLRGPSSPLRARYVSAASYRGCKKNKVGKNSTKGWVNTFDCFEFIYLFSTQEKSLIGRTKEEECTLSPVSTPWADLKHVTVEGAISAQTTCSATWDFNCLIGTWLRSDLSAGNRSIYLRLVEKVGAKLSLPLYLLGSVIV